MWYQILNKAATEPTEVFIFDEIGMFGIDAGSFVKDLQAIKNKEILLRLNTPGGSVFDGIAIANAIKSHPAKVVAQIDGIAASIGSIIALAADEVRMFSTSWIMIHKAHGLSMGSAEDLRKTAETLDKIDGVLAKTYADKTELTQKETLALMGDETWFTAQEAIDIGLADSVVEGGGEEASFDLSKFVNLPEGLKGKDKKQIEAEEKRDQEKYLQELGFSQKEAKVIIAEGAEGLKEKQQRDAVDDDRVAVTATLNKISVSTLTHKFERG